MIKYNKDLLQRAVKESISVAEVIRRLGLKQSGGTHVLIKNKIIFYDLDTTHFLGQAANKKYQKSKKKLFSEILIFRKNSNKRQPTLQLRRALIESGREYKCELCSLKDQWNNQEIRLEVDHINNDWLDDRCENLRFLCPNCHSQQKHKANQGQTGLLKNNRYKLFENKHSGLCLDCSRKISKHSTKCKSCSKKNQPTKIIWPSSIALNEMLLNDSYCEVARKLGVSDTAIRKRLKCSRDEIGSTC